MSCLSHSFGQVAIDSRVSSTSSNNKTFFFRALVDDTQKCSYIKNFACFIHN